MNLQSLKTALQSNVNMTYRSQYNNFWQWKVAVEKNPGSHILDDSNRAQACKKLLDVLPSWQTWRGSPCNYEKAFPIALTNIADAYAQIRQYSLLNFNAVPTKPLQHIWSELGRVKEQSRRSRPQGDYFVIAVCKPLMFLWGQTLAFDSKNRTNIRKDASLSLTAPIPRRGRWEFSEWRATMSDFQRLLCGQSAIVTHIQQSAAVAFGSTLVIPYGRYLDIYYF